MESATQGEAPAACGQDLQTWVFYIKGIQVYVTGFEKRDLIAHFEKIELLLP